MLDFFVPPIVAGGNRHPYNFDLLRLEKRHHRHLVRASWAGTIRVDQHQPFLRNRGKHRSHQRNDAQNRTHWLIVSGTSA
jgi:hypothetical protein